MMFVIPRFLYQRIKTASETIYPECQKFFSEFLRFRTNRMNDMVIPSLRHATMVKIAMDLWNQIDIRESISKFKFLDINLPHFREWREIEDKVLLKMAKFPIHEQLKKDLMSVISSIGVEIKNWWGFHQYEIYFLNLPNQFVWTLGGTIDRKRTAEMLLKDEEIEVEIRYLLACIYCLEDEIPKMWNRIPNKHKRHFLSKEERRGKMSKLIKYWTYHLFGNASDIEDITREENWQRNFPHGYAFLSALEGGNLVATEFFFAKLNEEQRDNLFVRYVQAGPHGRLHSRNTEEYYSEIFFFLLSHMSDEQRALMVEWCPCDVFSCFLDRPFQHFFMPLVEPILALRPFKNDISYTFLLFSISQKMVAGWRDFDYSQLFIYIWNHSPLTIKRKAIEFEQIFWLTLRNVLEVGDKAIVASLLEHVTTLERTSILNCGISRYLVRREKWDSIELLLEACEPTKEVIIELKDNLINRYLRSVRRSKGELIEEADDDTDVEAARVFDFVNVSESDEPKWIVLSHLLDELIDLKNETENVE